MVYVGSGLRSVHGHGIEPALIDPGLRVTKPVPSYRGHDLPRVPNYTHISPPARGRYLQWLADGRKDHEISIGFVFLFFCGLERRLLADNCPLEEQAELIAEIERLRAIYAQNAEFEKYSFGLLDYLRAKELDTFWVDIADYAAPPVCRTWDQPYSSTLRLGLGQCAFLGMEVPASWALTWAESHPGYRQRTAAERCRSEFEELFSIEYITRFSYGLSLPLDGPQIQFAYQPASGSFAGPVTVQSTIPDVTVFDEPGTTLKEIAMSCLEQLDAYSRFLGRSPQLRQSGIALALLPQPLFESRIDRILPDLRPWLETTRREGFAAVNERKLLEMVGIDGNTISTKDAVLLAQLLDRLNMGIEPDPRFSSVISGTDRTIVLFRLLENRPTASSSGYWVASAVMSLALAVILADGPATPVELEVLEKCMTETASLSAAEQLRLRAHVQWLLGVGPQWKSARKNLERLPLETREGIVQFVVEVAQADGEINPPEIGILIQIYRFLRLDTGALFSAAHAHATEPVSVREKGRFTPGYMIPSSSRRCSLPNLAIDMDRVNATVSESETVSELLREIFQDEDQAEPSLMTRNENALGLDDAHSRFLQKVLTKENWSRADLERIAADAQLLLDGALDVINERALADYNDLLLEGDDPIDVNPVIAGELNK